MRRTYVVTGAASGIGAAARTLLEQQGHTVIGVDVQPCDVTVDLATADGRAQMVEAVTGRSGGVVDAVMAVAGLAGADPRTARLNYFGALGTLEGLRPLLAQSPAPRAVAVASMASLHPHDPELVDLLLAGDVRAADARAATLATEPTTAALIYSSSKQALARWIRRTAPTPAWAGHGIPLNAVAPGVVLTPMTAPLLNDENGAKLVADSVPMPLNGFAPPEAVAWPLTWLTGPENTHMCGQVVFVDGGSDAVIRGDRTW